MKWTRRAVAMLGTVPDGDIARLLGMTRSGVSAMRRAVGVPAREARVPTDGEIDRRWEEVVRRGESRQRPKQPWTAEELALIGTVGDRELAPRIGRTAQAIGVKRRALGIEAREVVEFRAKMRGEA